MLHRVLVLAAAACCLIIGVSFAIFARDQISGASTHQVDELQASAPAPTALPSHEATTPASANRTIPQPSEPRHTIDSAARALTSPFAGLVPSESAWVRRGVPTVVALLVYGLGLGYLARYTQSRS